jgi:3-hydroxyisobutyrate dehydrogenase-like beta-hydroxyacid dehydrogenase
MFSIGPEPSSANLVKLTGNFLIAAAIESLGEAIALIGKAGIDRHAFVDLLTSTIFPAPAYKTYGGLIADNQFEPAGFAAPLGFKDIRLTLTAAEALRVPLPIGGLLQDRFLTFLAHGGQPGLVRHQRTGGAGGNMTDAERITSCKIRKCCQLLGVSGRSWKCDWLPGLEPQSF